MSLDAIHATCTAQSHVRTSLGEVLLARSSRGLSGLWFEGQKHHPGTLAARNRPDDELLVEAARQIQAYLAGSSSRFDLPLDLHGTAFQCAVWRALLEIAHGQTRSYRQIAAAPQIGSGARAVGGAIGRNPLSVIVPCHRVVGSNGSLTGYAGGVDRKHALLKLEAAHWPM